MADVQTPGGHTQNAPTNILSALKTREHRQLTVSNLTNNTLNYHSSLISRLTLTKVLSKHTGCVNSLDFSECGSLLASGSDDTNVCIWSLYPSEGLRNTIKTGHKANIFGCRFLPNTGNKVLVSCSRDTTVRVCEVETGAVTEIYKFHTEAVKRISVFKTNPSAFLACSEDGTVRQYDRRLPAEAQYHPVILDYTRHRIDLTALSLHSNQRTIAVGGSDPRIFLHDLRYPKNPFQILKPPNEDPTTHVTSIKFSKYSDEIIGSWNPGFVHLFDIGSTPKPNPKKCKCSIVKRKIVSYTVLRDKLLKEIKNGIEDVKEMAAKLRACAICEIFSIVREDCDNKDNGTQSPSKKQKLDNEYASNSLKSAIGYITDAEKKETRLQNDILLCVAAWGYALYNPLENSTWMETAVRSVKWQTEIDENAKRCFDAVTDASQQTIDEWKKLVLSLELDSFLDVDPDYAEVCSECDNDSEQETESSDDEEDNVIRSGGFSEVPHSSHTRMYCGHSNVQTTKDVSFLDPEENYIASGSDDGCIYIYDKHTSRIRNILRCDTDVVNVIVGHPYRTLIASSGIDDTVKLFEPVYPKKCWENIPQDVDFDGTGVDVFSIFKIDRDGKRVDSEGDDDSDDTGRVVSRSIPEMGLSPNLNFPSLDAEFGGSFRGYEFGENGIPESSSMISQIAAVVGDNDIRRRRERVPIITRAMINAFLAARAASGDGIMLSGRLLDSDSDDDGELSNCQIQ